MTHASVLAIGTELTQGQITNRNATWISELLTNLGIEVLSHLTVPDDRPLMLAALESLSMESELLVVTGGLGPTTDDFTRDVVADWLGVPLEFREASWDKIVRRLSERGIEVAQSNRIQCFFPKGSTVLENNEGTADGFRLRRIGPRNHSTEVIVLPGPPREGQHLWKTHLETWFAATFPSNSRMDLETWHCVGKSESSLGEIVESAVERFGVKTGYRASMPYVEVKIWMPATFLPHQRAELVAKLDHALAPFSITRNGADLAVRFAETLSRFGGSLPVTIRDEGSAGRLTERLLTVLRSPANAPLRTRIAIRSSFVSPSNALLPLENAEPEWTFGLDSNGRVTLTGPGAHRSRSLSNPYPHPSLADRLAGYRTEMTLKAFTEMMKELSPSGSVLAFS